MLKAFIKRCARSVGLEISRYRPSNSANAQLNSALSHLDIDLIFDVGANQGQFAMGIREYGYVGRIVSFEPLTEARFTLKELSDKDSAWTMHEQCAIGDNDGRIDINISGNSVSSSVLPMLDSHSAAAENSGYVAAESVPIFKLDSVAGQYMKKDDNLFLKIDTQGYEWQVLDGATDTLALAKGVLCELSLVPLYEGQRLWRDIVDRLEHEGFMLWALQKGFTDPRTGQSLQMDGIFLRRDLLKFGKSQ
jgi:FkbM family methyltransferase